MTNRYSFILLLSLLLLAPSFTAVAQNGAEQPPPPPRVNQDAPVQMRGDRMQARPNAPTQMRARMLSGQDIPGLTEEQRQQISSIRLEARQGETDLENQIRELRARLRTATTGSSLDLGEAENIIDDIAGLEAELMKLQVNTRNDIRNQLTDEQKILFDTRSGNDSFRRQSERLQGRSRSPQMEYRSQGPRFRQMMPDGSPSARRGMMQPPPAPQPSQPPPVPQAP